jgi:hypothetical protein
MDFQSTQAKQKQKNFPQNFIKSWDVTGVFVFQLLSFSTVCLRMRNLRHRLTRFNPGNAHA